MAYNLITKAMNGTIDALNTTFEVDGKKYSGLEFIIVFPIDKINT